QTCRKGFGAWPCPHRFLCLDFEEEAVSVGIKELAAFPVLCLHLIVIEIRVFERSRMLIPT
ncbi:MAG: hypothetical protein AB2556_24010, partial [Candidatus Thiodiazotropha sp.]